MSETGARPLGLLLRHLRPYAGWGALALVAVLGFALTTASQVALIEPLFTEVLLTAPPQALGAVAGRAPADAGSAPEADAKAAPAAATEVARRSILDLRRHLLDAFARLRAAVDLSPEHAFYFVPLLVLAVSLLRSLADFGSNYCFQRIGLGVTTDLRNDLFRRIVDQTPQFHEEHPSGELLSRVVNDVSIMQAAVSTQLLDLFQQSVVLVFLTVLLLSTSLELGLICLVVAPLILYPMVRFGRGMWKTSHRSQERMADLSQLLSEVTRGHRVVKAFGMEDFEHARFREATRRHLKVKLRSQIFANVSGPVVAALAAMVVTGFFLYAGHAIRAGRLTGPLIVQFLANLLMMYDPIRRLNKVNLVLQEASAALERVSELLALPNAVEDRPGARVLDGFGDRVRFEGVELRYGAKEVLRGVDLELRRGEVVALVGQSGGGKTSLTNLLLRFRDPDGGRITIDGVDLRDLTLRSLRGLVALVTQETVLFAGSVRSNIAYGQADVPLERIRAAAVAAHADEFIREMPEGYETQIGEGGLRLSGGQRQRLAIARALLKDAPILILDEATSQLDAETESILKQALANLLRGRTALIVAHRLSTVTAADRIAVVVDGRIVEQGAHAELLARDGIYRRLHDLQLSS